MYRKRGIAEQKPARQACGVTLLRTAFAAPFEQNLRAGRAMSVRGEQQQSGLFLAGCIKIKPLQNRR